jgi:hypothetical protein
VQDVNWKRLRIIQVWRKKAQASFGQSFPPCDGPRALDKWSLELTQGNSLGQSSLTSDGYEDLGCHLYLDHDSALLP